jgi:RNA polymerase sigma-70 factor, ECF subfamily
MTGAGRLPGPPGSQTDRRRHMGMSALPPSSIYPPGQETARELRPRDHEPRSARDPCRPDPGAAAAGAGEGSTLQPPLRHPRARLDDHRTFESFVERFWTGTLHYAQSVATDAESAADATQEAFSRLWERRSEWPETRAVRMWLLRAVRNLTITEHRKWKVRTLLATRVVAETAHAAPTPLQETENRELRAAINRAVGELPPRRREAFLLFHVQGFSYREIADIMDVREQTVANYLRAALADLRGPLAPFLPALRSPREPLNPAPRSALD